MFAPGANQLAAEFGITNSTIAAMTVSIYILGFAVGPLFIAPFSELYGRLIIYHLCTVFYFAFTLGCAFSTNTAMFLVFRFICGCAASGPMTVGGGTVADTTSEEKRGAAMALFSVGPLLGPTIGPVIGGFVTENTGWRWTFRIIMIMSGTLAIPSFYFLRETNGAIILERKAQRLRKETGNPHLVSKQGSTPRSRQTFSHSIVRPTKMLIFSPIVLLLSLYAGLIFGLIFLLFTTFPNV
ncbi:uncharacterized protein A1O9_01009 [Exophiala aquamarina CBS 119918]|uniref:Major facilitator superfamily (MFS) profile domain-containing protein n=1 Tax=Exophiala aquamarina CBS 119918 TaxID=1182545 RepID=A0A072PUK1_9EURO|nr:uncharacterized protein A1O9_01009 [Exophiala aquamarina CBS 119918]KEF63033.1 hypothetical protein A1O9_01009 [Exophiala aquamarina CBS 119918]